MTACPSVSSLDAIHRPASRVGTSFFVWCVGVLSCASLAAGCGASSQGPTDGAVSIDDVTDSTTSTDGRGADGENANTDTDTGTTTRADSGPANDGPADAEDATASTDAPLVGEAGAAADATTGSDATTTSEAGTGATYRVPFDWNGIVGNGQSLSVGRRGTPELTTAQPFHNLKLFDATGKYALDSSGTLSLVPLVEPIRTVCAETATAYPCNINGETPHTALSIELTTLAKAAGAADYVTLHSVVGQGSQPLAVIDKAGADGGNAYAATLSEARSFQRLADAAGKKFGYVAVVFTHGEADNAEPAAYESGVYQLYENYNQDLAGITGQTQPIVLVASQQVTYPPNGNGLTNTPMTGTAFALWHAGVDHPGQVVCSGPKYQYRYYATNSSGATDPHVYSAGYRRLGEKYAEIIDTVVNRRLAWQPLQPTTASLSGTSLTVNFQVPAPPLAWEPSLEVSTTVSAWSHGRGFEVVDSKGPVTISATQISGSSVVLTLAAAPTGTGLRVRYVAYNGCTANCGNHLVGQLRDSDPFLGADVQAVACDVTQGSASVVCPSVGGASPLASREVHDVVSGIGLADDTVVVSTDKATNASLSSPWTGASGTATLTFAYDERNYAVQFDMAVP
jgi:hypothetical protein